MNDRYLLTVIWRRRTAPIMQAGVFNYLTCIHWSPTAYLKANLKTDEEEHHIIHSHKLTDAEYDHISPRVEDFTREDP